MTLPPPDYSQVMMGSTARDTTERDCAVESYPKREPTKAELQAMPLSELEALRRSRQTALALEDGQGI